MSNPDSPLLIAEPAPGVRLLTLNRPHVRNALSNELLGAIASAVNDARDAAAVHCMVVTGNGGTFAAGADINELATRTTAASIVDVRMRYWEDIRRFPKPLIAAVEGYALGGGCELALHADIIVAAENAQFGQPEINLGLIPGAGGIQRLARRVGHTLAMRMVLTGERIDGKAAAAAGLATEAVGAGTSVARALELARVMAEKPPLAMRLAKEMVLASRDLPLDWGLVLERKAFATLLATDDFREGVAAFREKRKPRFKGS
jgi:enoyl-CoA hydratase